MRSKHFAKLLGAAGAAILAIAMLAPLAQAETPAPGYSQFAGCPSPKSEKPEVATCITSKVTGGHFKMGNKDVPITVPFTLSGGINASGENFQYNSKGGLSPAKQKVPGGVIGLTGLTWLAEFLGIEALTLYAQTELAGQPKPAGVGEVELLPIKVHLINGALGNNCYVGSTANPIKLHLITGTTSPPPPNKPISGVFPEITFNEELEILKGTNGKFVDNSFSAPGASGCVLTLFGFIPISINGLVNTASGLPAAAGTNETTQNYTIEVAAANRVYP
jgi:hypothetical protein